MKKLMALVLAIAMVLSLSATGKVPAYAEKAEETEVIKDIRYLDDDIKFHLLDLYAPGKTGEKKPVIVEVHGGSYVGGVKEINTKHSIYYADHGFAVANTNYTTMANGGFDNVVQDLNAVLLWIETHAEEYGLDKEHVFMSGDSAGGYFVTLMAAVLASDDLQKYYGVNPPDYTVKGFILTCPGSDIPALAAALNDENAQSFKIASRIGEAVLGNEDIINHADLYTIIDAATFPEVYILTTPDDEILYSESLHLHEYLNELGIEHSYTEYVSEENKLEHVFNIGHVDWIESIKANDDIISYLQSKCPELSFSEPGIVPVPLKTVEADPADENYYAQVIETELYNLRILRNIPSVYDPEKYDAFLSSANMLKKMDPEKLIDAQKEVLDKLVGLQNELVQVISYDDAVWPIWGSSMPCTERPEDLVFTSDSYDNPDMKPYLLPYLMEDQENVKGNLIIVAGGGYSSRNNKGEGFPIAAAFNERGYNCFILQRRVAPYSAEDIWMDMQRSIRYLRYYGNEIGLGAMDNLLAAGFSGGSATIIGALENLYGDIQPTVFDPNYEPDAIDAMNSDLDVAFLIYGPNPSPVHDDVYEGLITDNENLPELFIAAGADDPTGAPEDNWTLYQSVRGKTNAELHTFANVAHGFGVGFKGTNSTFWIDMADNFVTQSLESRAKAK